MRVYDAKRIIRLVEAELAPERTGRGDSLFELTGEDGFVVIVNEAG